MTITFKPQKKTVNTRQRGYRTVVDDPVDATSSATFLFENIDYTDDGTVVGHDENAATHVINAPTTAEEAAEPQMIFDKDGKAITTPIVINPIITKAELWGVIKQLMNSGLLNDLNKKGLLDA